jgi:hypothetical protein
MNSQWRADLKSHLDLPAGRQVHSAQLSLDAILFIQEHQTGMVNSMFQHPIEL